MSDSEKLLTSIGMSGKGEVLSPTEPPAQTAPKAQPGSSLPPVQRQQPWA